MNHCACGCGAPTRGVWVHGGHAQRVCRFMPAGGKGAVPFARVQPLLTFLWEQGSATRYGRDIRLAQALGVSYSRIWRWRNRPPLGVPYTTARRIVAAVKAVEESLRVEAYRDHARTERAKYRAVAR